MCSWGADTFVRSPFSKEYIAFFHRQWLYRFWFAISLKSTGSSLVPFHCVFYYISLEVERCKCVYTDSVTAGPDPYLRLYISNYCWSRTSCLCHCLHSVVSVFTHVTSVKLDGIYKKASNWTFSAEVVFRAPRSEVCRQKRILGSSVVTCCKAQPNHSLSYSSTGVVLGYCLHEPS